MTSADPGEDGADRLDVPQDVRFQHISWRVQAVLRWLALGAVLAGAIGFFGGGWIGMERVRDPSGRLEVTQPRFARIDSRFEVRFQIAPALVRDGRVSIWFNQGFLQSFALDSVSPEPEREEIDDFRTIFRFAAAAAPRQPVTIRFQFRTTRMGPGRGHAGVLDGPAVPLAHLIYP